MVPVVQMNVGIDSSLKERGDAVLAGAGYTPTQAVRALWTIASGNKGNPSRLIATH